MKKYIFSIILSLLITSVALARSTGCKEGNCENGFGKWVYTDKTTYEGEWVGTKKNGQGVETWPNGYILIPFGIGSLPMPIRAFLGSFYICMFAAFRDCFNLLLEAQPLTVFRRTLDPTLRLLTEFPVPFVLSLLFANAARYL